MEVARHWRLKDERYMGAGRRLVGFEVDEQNLWVRNRIKGREINLNHGSPDGEHLAGWATGLVKNMRDWGYGDEIIGEVALGIAERMNGSGEQFLEEVMEIMIEGVALEKPGVSS